MAECPRCQGQGFLCVSLGGVFVRYRCCAPVPVAPPVRLRRPPRCRACGLEGLALVRGLCAEDAALAARRARVARALEAG